MAFIKVSTSHHISKRFSLHSQEVASVMYVFLLTVTILAITVQGFAPRGLMGLKMKIDLPPLPYPYDSLEPHLDKKTLEIHHDKHHAKYVNTANEMIAGTDMENDDAITLLKKSYGNNQGLFNNAAQSFNHAFY